LEPQKSTTKYTGKADIGGSWMLYDTNGNPYSSKDLEGKYYLIYFGFTFCPDVCPVSLMKMSNALNMVKESKEYTYFDLDALFVSVDPDRDSNERIEEYCKIFHPDLKGLTHKSNSNEDLKTILKKFKIHVSKILLTEEEEQEDMKSLQEHAPQVIEKLGGLKKKKDDKYTLDHSIIVYLIGPDNQFLTYLGSNLDEKDMANLILDEISADLKKRIMPG
jgi:protein SCO1